MVLVCLLVVGTIGCQPATTVGSATEGIQAQTSRPDGTDMACDVPARGTGDKMAALAKRHLANMLGVTREQIVVASVEAVQWRDAGLGCSKPGVDYMPPRTGLPHLARGRRRPRTSTTRMQGNRVILCRTGRKVGPL